MNDTEGVPSCVAAHGLSVYVEAGKRRILVDTGCDARTWDNAKALGVNPEEVDTVVLSHGHYDHTGGVMSFAGKNPRAEIILHRRATLGYYNLRDGERYIGIDPRIPSLPQVSFLNGDGLTELSVGADDGASLYVFGGAAGQRLWPEGNRVLKRKTDEGFVQDTFDHEVYAVVTENGRNVLISGCAHCGMINILDRYRELFGGLPDAVVSGFHLMMPGAYTPEQEAMIRETAEILKSMPIRYFTGHCTSLPAYEIMKPILGDRLTYFGSGEEIVIE